MGFSDLLLFYLVTGFTVRWIATAAAAGPSAIVIWLLACLAFYVPLMFTVLELSSRYPDEGGCYVWSRRAFGDFAGFITGWTYWACNLPYFPGLFYFTAATALFIGGPDWRALGDSPTYFIGFSLVALLLAAGLNVRGLTVGKWLHNLGALGLWLPGLLLIGLGVHSRAHGPEHQTQGHRILVYHRVFTERPGKRVDDGGGNPRCAAEYPTGAPDGGSPDHCALCPWHRSHARRRAALGDRTSPGLHDGDRDGMWAAVSGRPDSYHCGAGRDRRPWPGRGLVRRFRAFAVCRRTRSFPAGVLQSSTPPIWITVCQ